MLAFKNNDKFVKCECGRTVLRERYAAHWLISHIAPVNARLVHSVLDLNRKTG